MKMSLGCKNGEPEGDSEHVSYFVQLQIGKMDGSCNNEKIKGIKAVIILIV